MEYKKLTQKLERNNFFKNIAVKATDHCIKSFDDSEISEEEDKCLKKAALNLYFITERNRFEDFIVTGYPPHSW